MNPKMNIIVILPLSRKCTIKHFLSKVDGPIRCLWTPCPGGHIVRALTCSEFSVFSEIERIQQLRTKQGREQYIHPLGRVDSKQICLNEKAKT